MRLDIPVRGMWPTALHHRLAQTDRHRNTGNDEDRKILIEFETMSLSNHFFKNDLVTL